MFHGFFAAMIAGALALIAGIVDKENILNLLISIGICFLLMFLGYITMKLRLRWSNAFDRHMEYAKGCYYFLHKTLFGGKKSASRKLKYKDLQEALKIEKRYNNDKSMKAKIKLDSMLLYCFNIRNSASPENNRNIFQGNTKRTKVLFQAFDNATILILRFVIFFLAYKFFSVTYETSSLSNMLYHEDQKII